LKKSDNIGSSMERERLRFSRKPLRSPEDMAADSRERLNRMKADSQARLEQMRKESQERKDKFNAEREARTEQLRREIEESKQDSKRQMRREMEAVGVFPWVYTDEQIPQEEAERIMLAEEAQTIDMLQRGYAAGDVNLSTIGMRRLTLSFTRDLIAATLDKDDLYKATRAHETRERNMQIHTWIPTAINSGFAGIEVLPPILTPRSTEPSAE
jgi:hypothetical protein